MAIIYATLIIKGKKTFADVPDKIKDKVKEVLIDLDCGHCADKIQNAVKKIDGVTSVSVNFLGQKMVLEAPDDKFDAVLAEAKALIKKIEPDVTVKA